MENIYTNRTLTIFPGPATKVVIEAKLSSLGQGLYFSTQYTEYEARARAWRACSWGSDVGQFADHCPEVALFAKWHLCYLNSGPVHYLANGLYWAGCDGWCDGKPNSPPNLDSFKKTVIWGSAPGDSDNESRMLELFETRDKSGLIALLTDRIVGLMDAFDADMNALFGEGTIVRKRKET